MENEVSQITRDLYKDAQILAKDRFGDKLVAVSIMDGTPTHTSDGDRYEFKVHLKGLMNEYYLNIYVRNNQENAFEFIEKD